jgi:hypothetical protein
MEDGNLTRGLLQGLDALYDRVLVMAEQATVMSNNVAEMAKGLTIMADAMIDMQRRLITLEHAHLLES